MTDKPTSTTKDEDVLERRVQFLKGAGPRRAEHLERLDIRTVGDLLLHVPRDYIDRSRLRFFGDVREGETVVSQATVESVVIQPARRMRNFRAILRDPSGRIEAVWFNQPFLANHVREGSELMVSGPIERFRGKLQLRNPEYEVVTGEEQEMLTAGRIVPVYPLTQGVSQKVLRLLVRNALDLAKGEIREHLPKELRTRHRLLDRAEAIGELHFPSSHAQREAARRRIAYDHLFLSQLVFQARRRYQEKLPGIAFPAKGELARRVVNDLPFTLTADQKTALVEIRDDLRAPRPMNRLLDGEVGAGKTVVALLAACLVLEDAWQVAVLAPTEILAEQHATTMTRLLARSGIAVHLLTGSTRAAPRRHVLTGAASGEVAIFVGTHALIQESVRFARLGLVIVDEQHRFGVKQRAELKAKASGDGGEGSAPVPGEGDAVTRDIVPDTLIMTATPIPRTAAMVLHGDLDRSVIRTLPEGRGRIRTRLVREEKRETVYGYLRTELEQGHRAYIVCPLVEESEKSDLRAAKAMAEALSVHAAFSGYRVDLLHGKMKADEKARVMLDFREGRCHVLVATTVVEVGVDVPEATVMLVEHPERYGLSQLHQLRGRIGRGGADAVFVLMGGQGLSFQAFKRLRTLERETSGYAIAAADLRERGAGNILGTQQHGHGGLGLVDLEADRALIEASRQDAAEILADDPDLAEADHEGLRARVTERFGEAEPFFHVG